VLAPVAVADGDDQLLPDVAREVEVDVGHGGELAVEEAPDGEVGGDGIDMREAGQVADDGADRAAAPSARGKEVARRAGASNLGGDLARKLEHLPVEEEEAGEAELGDEGELLAQALVRVAAEEGRGLSVALLEGVAADARELDVGRVLAVGEVRVAVAELLREVELEPPGELAGGTDGVCVVREAGGGLVGREEDALLVATPLGLAPFERGLVPDGDEDVLEAEAAGVVRVHVSCGDGADAERLGERAQGGVAACVSAGIGALELDVEALAPEDAREAGAGGRVRDREAVTGAAGEADETLVPLLEEGEVEARVQALVRVGGGEEAAEVRVAARALDKERDVRAVTQGDLGAGERAQAERLRGVGKLERAVEAVVVGEREDVVAELGGAGGELLGQGGAVEEGVGGVRVELDVCRRGHERPS
jgi:hypothetical protein